MSSSFSRIGHSFAILAIAATVAFVAVMLAPCNAHAAWSEKSGYFQASCYGLPDEPYETVTATGKKITSKVRYVAVPIGKTVKKSKWKKLSKAKKYKLFYYGQRLRIFHGKRSMVVTVQDCGGFGSFYGYRKGKKVMRMFDLTPAVKKGLKVDGLGFVRFSYEV